MIKSNIFILRYRRYIQAYYEYGKKYDSFKATVSNRKKKLLFFSIRKNLRLIVTPNVADNG